MPWHLMTSRREGSIGIGLFVACCLLVGCRDSIKSSFTSADPATADIRPSPSAAEATTGDVLPLVVLVVNDPLWGPALEREWNADSALPIVTQAVTAADIESESAAVRDSVNRADLILFPAGLLGSLVEKQQIDPVPGSANYPADVVEQLHPPDLLPLVKSHRPQWGTQQYAVSLGGAPWLLLYRRDLLELANIAPPDTWSALDASLAELAKLVPAWQTVGKVGTAFRLWLEPSDVNMSSQLFLARGAAYARHPGHYSTFFDYRTAKPLIDQPPFVRALTEQRAAWRHDPQGFESVNEQTVEARFLAGEVAVVAWRPRRWDNYQSQPDGTGGTPWALAPTLQSNQIGAIALPGATECYNFSDQTWETHTQAEVRRVGFLGPDDRLGGVVARSRRKRIAWAFLAQVAGSDRTRRFLAECGNCSPYRTSHLSEVSDWLPARQADIGPVLADAIQQAYSLPDAMVSPRIPGTFHYLHVLDEHVLATLRDGADPTNALRGAADAWNVSAVGQSPEKRRTAYLRSLGLEP